MASKATFLRVGLLLVGGVAAAIGLVVFLSRGEVRNGRTFESYFRESVEGLDVGSPVKFRGVTLGQVTEIALVSAVYSDTLPDGLEPASFELVMVRYTVDARKAGHVLLPGRQLESGLRARLASQGITGLSYIELDIVTPGQFPPQSVPWTPREPNIPSMPSTITQVQDAAQALLAKLQAVDLARLTEGLQRLLDDMHRELTDGDAHAVLAEAEALLRTLRLTVERADLAGLTADLRATSGAARGIVQGKPVRDLLLAVAQAAERLPRLITTLEVAVRRAEDDLGDVQHELDPVLRDARATAANLRETSEALRRYPAGELLGAPPPRPAAR